MKNFLKILVFILCIYTQAGTYTYTFYNDRDQPTGVNTTYLTIRGGNFISQNIGGKNLYPITYITPGGTSVGGIGYDGSVTEDEDFNDLYPTTFGPSAYFSTYATMGKILYGTTSFRATMKNRETGEKTTEWKGTSGSSRGSNAAIQYCLNNIVRIYGMYYYYQTGTYSLETFYDLKNNRIVSSGSGCTGGGATIYAGGITANSGYGNSIAQITNRTGDYMYVLSVRGVSSNSSTEWNLTYANRNINIPKIITSAQYEALGIEDINDDSVYAYYITPIEDELLGDHVAYLSYLFTDNSVKNYLVTFSSGNFIFTETDESDLIILMKPDKTIIKLTCDDAHLCTDISRGEEYNFSSSYKKLQLGISELGNFTYYSLSNGMLMKAAEGITVIPSAPQFTQGTLTPSVTTSGDCTTKYITRNDSQCKYLDNTVTATCEAQDDGIYTHCLIENDNIQIDAYNLLDVQNPANILVNTAIEDVFTFKDSNGIFTRGSSQPVFKIKTKNENNKISMLYMYDNNLTSEDDYEAYNVVMYPYNQDLGFLSEIGAQTGFIGESFKINNATFLGANINSFSLLIAGGRMFTQQTYKLSFGIYGPCSATYRTTVCKGSDGYVYIDGEKTGEINDNIDNIQERVDSVYTPDRINDMGITPSMNSSIGGGLCGGSYNRRDVGDFSGIDILTIIPCGIPYVAQKAYNLFKRMFTFNFNLNKEKETEGFWDWVRNNAGALLPYKAEAADSLINSEWIGYEGEGNEQVNNIMNAWGNNSTTRINENTLGLATILFKVIINIAAFVFMLTCFTKQSENYSGETLIGAGLKVFLFIFFIFIVITLEFIVQYTDLNPLGLNAIFNFIDFGYRTAIEMMLIGVLGYTTRNFI